MPGRNSTRAYLGLGGNLGDPAAAMAAALRAIHHATGVEVVAVSPLYRTPPWGLADQPDFLNAVAAIDTTVSPRELLQLCLATELELKRVRDIRWGPRVIDIDVLLFGEAKVEEVGLQVPHPRMLERAFVLAPLADIAPDLVVSGVPVAARLAQFDLAGIVRQTEDGAWWRES